MILLAIDTCDSRGSVAALRYEALLKVITHESQEDYSSWLLPAVEELLAGAEVRLAEVDAYAVASGPGSFTGLRVGLTTVKAWSEIYKKPIVAVSRLEALAVHSGEDAPYIAAFTDAQRGQVFGAIYQRNRTGVARVGDEMVIPPGKFVQSVAETTVGERVSWVSTDANCILLEEAWKARERRKERIELVSSILAPEIGRLGARQLAAGRFTDALTLDANYVRRSDAEIFWKGSLSRGR